MNEYEQYKKECDGIRASDELIFKTIERVKSDKKKKRKIRVFCIQTAVAAAACFCFIIFNVVNLPVNSPARSSPLFTGSIFGEASIFALPVIIFVLLVALFIFLYRRK